MPADLERICANGHSYVPDNGCPTCRRERRLERHATYMDNQRRQRAATGNAHTKKYEKTPNGFLMRAYRNMQSRVTGVQSKKAHLYVGKSLCSRDEFYDWAKSDTEFWRLFREWEQSGYDRRFTPSVDRIDSGRGYELDNMQWLTHSENSRRASVREAA